ncbi:MAG: antibiotic biosynthesis monooxygenase family protein [Kineosporiaceae bacterium]
MSVVKINSIEVPAGREAAFEERFARRAGQVEGSPGFEEFMLLRPASSGGRYFVVTRWESEAAFRAWMSSRDFAEAHSRERTGAAGGTDEGAGPVATGSEILEFEVIERVSSSP